MKSVPIDIIVPLHSCIIHKYMSPKNLSTGAFNLNPAGHPISHLIAITNSSLVYRFTATASILAIWSRLYWRRIAASTPIKISTVAVSVEGVGSDKSALMVLGSHHFDAVFTFWDFIAFCASRDSISYKAIMIIVCTVGNSKGHGSWSTPCTSVTCLVNGTDMLITLFMSIDTLPLTPWSSVIKMYSPDSTVFKWLKSLITVGISIIMSGVTPGQLGNFFRCRLFA